MYRGEELGHSESVSLVMPYHKARVPSGTNPFSLRLTGSLSSSLHENYSMGELKECAVHSVEQLAERHIHSLATQRVQEAQEKWKASRD